MIIEAQGLKLLSKGNVAVWKTMLSEYQATDRVVVEQDIKQVFDAGDSETPKRLERLQKMRELMAEIDDASKVVEVEDLEFLDGKTKLDELEHLIKLEKAAKDFKTFIQLTKPDYQFNWHHQYMIDRFRNYLANNVSVSYCDASSLWEE